MENNNNNNNIIVAYEDLASQITGALEELFKYSDEEISRVKERYYQALAETYFNDEAYETILEAIKDAEREGYTRQEIIEDCENNKEILTTIFDEIRDSYSDSEVKQEVIDTIEDYTIRYMNAYLFQAADQDSANVFVELVHPNAKIPTYAHAGDQGADVYAVEEITLEPHTYGNVIPTGLKLRIPQGWAISIRPRSGLSKKTTLRISNSPATIDTAYRGEVKVLMDNIGDNPVTINVGERIAQMLIERNYQMNFEIVDSVEPDTERGEDGFGSSGV